MISSLEAIVREFLREIDDEIAKLEIANFNHIGVDNA